MAALLFFVAPLVVVLVETSDIAEDLKADDDDDVEYASLFLADDATTADDDFNTEKQSPMASCWLSNRMRAVDRLFIVGR